MKPVHKIQRTRGQVEAFRIILAMPGRERTLHQYKRPVGIELATRKASELACIFMRNWQWTHEVDAIEDRDSEDMILILGDSVKSGGVSCSL